MELEKIIREARESGEEIEDGLIWHTYALDEVIVQIPRDGDSWRVNRIRDIYDQLDSEVPKPELIEASESKEYNGVVFEKVEGEMFRNLEKRLNNQSECINSYEKLRNRYLNAVENAGEALALIHDSEPVGEGYGYFNRNENKIIAPQDNWRIYVEDTINDLGEVPELFEKAAQKALDNFDIDSVPEKPERSILHKDFNSGNIMVLEDGGVKVFDYDNAIYGDPNFGFVNSMFELCAYDDKEALRKFREGYTSVREADMSQEIEDNYVALAVLNSVEAGKWIYENRDVDFIEQYAEDVNSWAESYFANN